MTSADFREIAWLILHGVPFDVAHSMTREEREAFWLALNRVVAATPSISGRVE